jgi:single-strand DNA-binding protein
MASFNQALLIGRLAADPELKQTTSGTSVSTFSLAVDRRIKKDGDPPCDFLNIVAWKEQAEFICKYFRKGQQILIRGEIQVRSWTSRDGSKRYVTEIIAKDIGFVDSKKDDPTASTIAPSYNPYTNSAATSAEFEEVDDASLPF